MMPLRKRKVAKQRQVTELQWIAAWLSGTADAETARAAKCEMYFIPWETPEALAELWNQLRPRLLRRYIQAPDDYREQIDALSMHKVLSSDDLEQLFSGRVEDSGAT
jgi:hypothetical protein